jgi:IclR family acetate operon transcriptional repressor
MSRARKLIPPENYRVNAPVIEEKKPPGADDKYVLRSVSRALDILQALGNQDSEGMTVAELADSIGVSKSTAFTLLQTLLARGFVADERLGSLRRYRLGLSLVHLGDRAASNIGITQLALPVLQQLTHDTGLTSRLAVLDEGYAVAITRVDAPGIFRLAGSLGTRELPHCSGVGKALLALLPPARVLQILKRIGMPRRTDHTITDPAKLVKELVDVAERGYAFDDEEDNLGVICVASAITSANGDGIAAISVTSMKGGRSSKDMHELGYIVQSHANKISKLIGA